MSELIPHASRYVMSAAVVAATYIGLTLTLSGPAGLPIQAVIPFALVIACVVHYALQRRFVFADRDKFALSGRQQAQIYAPLVALQYAVTAAATAALPPILHASEQAVYVATVCAVSAATFLFLRSRVFHAA